MTNLNQFAKKAFYLGVGLASYAGEKASTQWQELRTNAQSLANELVERGELKAEEAGQFVDELLQQAKNPNTEGKDSDSREPRRIEIITEDEEPEPSTDDVDRLRSQVEELQARLRNLQQ